MGVEGLGCRVPFEVPIIVGFGVQNKYNDSCISLRLEFLEQCLESLDRGTDGFRQVLVLQEESKTQSLQLCQGSASSER